MANPQVLKCHQPLRKPDLKLLEIEHYYPPPYVVGSIFFAEC